MQTVGSKEHKRYQVLLGLLQQLMYQFRAEAEKIHQDHELPDKILPFEQFMELMPDEYVYVRRIISREMKALMARLDMMDEVKSNDDV